MAGAGGYQQQSEAAGRFLEHRSRQGREQHRIIPGCDDSGDVADVAPDRTQRSTIASIDCRGYSVVCLLPEKRSSSLLTMMRGPPACVTSISATPVLWVPDAAKPSDINGLAALQAPPDGLDRPACEFAVDAVKADARHAGFGEPPRETVARFRKSGMPWPDA